MLPFTGTPGTAVQSRGPFLHTKVSLVLSLVEGHRYLPPYVVPYYAAPGVSSRFRGVEEGVTVPTAV